MLNSAKYVVGTIRRALAQAIMASGAENPESCEEPGVTLPYEWGEECL